MLPEHEQHPFRVYSERQVDGSRFTWSPYMDLVAFFPSDLSNPSVTIWRLINDKQANSPLLFTEKIPFQGTAVSWVPDRRSLCVGDTSGNVFVYDAERQRTVELQKVHDSPIACLNWLDLGVMGSRFAIDSLSPCSLLAPIYPTIPSIQTWADDYEYLNQPELQCDQMGYSDKFILLTVLGQSGGISIYAGGSIPICEFHMGGVDTGARSYTSCVFSPDGSLLAVSSQSGENTIISVLDFGLISLRRVELFRISRIEARIHWLLKQLAVSLDVVGRAVSKSVEEYHNLFFDPMINEVGDDVLREEFMGVCSESLNPLIKSFLSKSLTVAKLTTVYKNTVNCLDYLVVVLVSHAGVIVDHLLGEVCELVDLVECDAKRYKVLGVDPVGLVDVVSELRKKLKNRVRKIQEKVKLIKDGFDLVFIPWVNIASGGNETGSPLSISSTDSVSDIFSLRAMVDFSCIFEVGKKIETKYTSILSSQRRAMGGRVTPVGHDIELVSESGVNMKWNAQNQLELCFIDQDGSLCLMNCGDNQTVRFHPPLHSEWITPKLYKDKKVFALLQHNQANSVSICSIDLSSFASQGLSVDVSPDEYGYPEILCTQQLPNWYFNNVTEFELCPKRALCSVVSQDNQRVLTLDLEPSLEEDMVDLDEEEYSSDGETVKAWNDPNKFVGKKGNEESSIFHRDDRESPEIGNYFG